MEHTLNINGAAKFLSKQDEKSISGIQIANAEIANELLTSINTTLQKSFDKLEKSFKKILSNTAGVKKNYGFKLNDIKNLFNPKSFLNGITNRLNKFSLPSISKYQMKGAVVKDYGKQIFQSVKGIGSKLANVGKSVWPFILMGIGLIKRGGLTLARTLIKGIVFGFRNIMLPLIRPILGFLKTLSLKVGSIFKNGLSKVKPVMSRAGSAVTKKLASTGLGRAAVRAGSRVGLRVGTRGAAVAAGGGIGSAAVLAAFAAKDLVANLKNIENVVGKAKENITFGDKIQTIFSSIVETLTFGLIPAKNVFSFIETTAMKIKTFFFNMGTIGQTILKSFLVIKNTWLFVYESIWNGIKYIGSEIGNIFISFKNKVVDFFEPVTTKINEITNSVSEFFTGIVDSVKSTVTTFTDTISEMFTNIFDTISKLPFVSTILKRAKSDFNEVANADIEKERLEKERLAKEAEAKRIKEQQALEKQNANTKQEESVSNKIKNFKFNNSGSSGRIINRSAFEKTKAVGDWGKPSTEFSYSTSNKSYAPIIQTTPKGSIAQTTPAREIDNVPRSKSPTEILQDFLIKDFIPKLAAALNVDEDKFSGVDFDVRPLV